MKKKKEVTALEALEGLRDDIRKMDWLVLGEDKHSVLVAKFDVLALVNDWVEYCLNPDY